MANLDWQGVVVTAAALVAALVIVRPLVARSRRDGTPSCPSCAAGRACSTKPGPIAVAPPRASGGPSTS